MAISKSLRFEVLRRDNHACRYCGGKAPEARLTIDHVVPVALGGRDEPANLVTACADCNNGKKATPPDAALVEDVAQDALRWSRAIEAAAQRMTAALIIRDADREIFEASWNHWKVDNKRGARSVPLPDDWKNTVDRFMAVGLPLTVLVDCVDRAMTNAKVSPENTFRYMCGIAWNRVAELQEAARLECGEPTETLDPDEPDDTNALGLADALLGFLPVWDFTLYTDYAAECALPYKPKPEEAATAAIYFAVRGIVAERELLYDITMGFLESQPNFQQLWDEATATVREDPQADATRGNIIKAATKALLNAERPVATGDDREVRA